MVCQEGPPCQTTCRNAVYDMSSDSTTGVALKDMHGDREPDIGFRCGTDGCLLDGSGTRGNVDCQVGQPVYRRKCKSVLERKPEEPRPAGGPARIACPQLAPR